MREQGRRAVGALILALYLAISTVSGAAAGELNSGKSHESAAELLLLTMLLAAAMTAPAEPRAASAHLAEADGQGPQEPQVACAAAVTSECAQPDQSAW